MYWTGGQPRIRNTSLVPVPLPFKPALAPVPRLCVPQLQSLAIYTVDSTMRATFELLFLAFSVLGQARASSQGLSDSSITWLEFQRSAVVKLETPGYPLWLMDKANAPILYEQAENFYWETDAPSAILLNLTISTDRKTLLLNHKPVLPFADYNVPPLLEAYQVPADYSQSQIKGLISYGLLNRQIGRAHV